MFIKYIILVFSIFLSSCQLIDNSIQGIASSPSTPPVVEPTLPAVSPPVITSLNYSNPLKFSNLSAPSSPVTKRIISPTSEYAWLLTGTCDPSYDSVLITGDIDQPTTTTCIIYESNGYFSLIINFDNVDPSPYFKISTNLSGASTGMLHQLWAEQGTNKSSATLLYKSKLGRPLVFISTATELAAIPGGSITGTDYILTSDIFVPIETAQTTSNWTAIPPQNPGTIRSFYGDGHQIVGIDIDTATFSLGLFSVIDAGYVGQLVLSNFQINGTTEIGALAGVANAAKLSIENIEVINSQITGTFGVGGIIGRTRRQSSLTQIAFYKNSSVSATDTTTGFWGVGGITGYLDNNTSLRQAYSDITINLPSEIRVGGLVGFRDSKNHIYNSIFTGSIVAKSQSGGISGAIDSFTVSDIGTINTLNTGAMTATTTANENVGPLTSDYIEATGTIIADFTDKSFYATNAACVNCDNFYGEGLSPLQLRDKNSFTDWDFTNIWRLSSDDLHPHLQWLDTESFVIPNFFIRNQKITAIRPFTYGQWNQFSVSPPLPLGLTLNIDTGLIVGTPTTYQEPLDYTISATSSEETVQRIITLAVGLELQVNTYLNDNDINIGDGSCATATSVCSLRAAVEEGNQISIDLGKKIPVRIVLPNGNYDLSLGGSSGSLTLTTSFDFRGVNESGTVIHGDDTFGLLLITGAMNDTYPSYFSNITFRLGQDFIGGFQGGAIFFAFTDVYIDNCIFADNKGSTRGGAISGTGIQDSLTISNSQFENNTARNYGGAIYTFGLLSIKISNTTFKNNSIVNPGSTKVGGALYVASGHVVSLHNNIFEGNTSISTADGYAGAIFSQDIEFFEITNSTFIGNASSHGAAFFGGVILKESVINIHNSTFMNNTIVPASGTEAAVQLNGGSMTTLYFKNSIIANTTAGENCSGTGTMVSLGGNIESENSCSLQSTVDQTNTNPMLDGLQDQGGWTKSLKPSIGSPVIDFASSCPPWDQRNYPRNIEVCDSGAVER